MFLVEVVSLKSFPVPWNEVQDNVKERKLQDKVVNIVKNALITKIENQDILSYVPNVSAPALDFWDSRHWVSTATGQDL